MKDWKLHLLNTYKDKALKHRETATAGVLALIWIAIISAILAYNVSHPKEPNPWINSRFPVNDDNLQNNRGEP
jgi:hypothetical protein